MVAEHKIQAFRQKLLAWGENNTRHYPWRETSDPYSVLVAELMLRRTKAEQALPVYEAFMASYPTLSTLSDAAPSDIREILAPLGLNWRIENLVQLARAVNENRLDRIPESLEDLQLLPGVGPYVAGVVRCLAYGRAAPVLDTNVVRVLGRFFGLSLAGEPRRKKEMLALATECVESKAPKQYTLALIDFGALVCTPSSPQCRQCPLRSKCSFLKSRDEEDT